jgi:hypothetical protein
VRKLRIKDKIEFARNILNNSKNMCMSRGIILRISQKIDKYIVEYYREIKRKEE